MNKPYHERPDWILKSIGYFCDNYTIDGKDLGEMKRGAIKEYLKSPAGHISNSISFANSPQGFTFWDCLYWLQGCWPGPSIGEKCAPWTDDEKREIAKLPRVK
jgi:hypothetical protein